MHSDPQNIKSLPTRDYEVVLTELSLSSVTQRSSSIVSASRFVDDNIAAI